MATAILIIGLLSMFFILAFYMDDIIEFFKPKPKPEPAPKPKPLTYGDYWKLFEDVLEPWPEEELIRANAKMQKMEIGLTTQFQGFDWVQRMAYIKTYKQNKSQLSSSKGIPLNKAVKPKQLINQK